jgi:hypothetical protein
MHGIDQAKRSKLILLYQEPKKNYKIIFFAREKPISEQKT